MQKSIILAAFCICVGMLARASEPPVSGCPAGLVCLTQPQAAAIVARFNEMTAMLDRVEAMVDERDKALADIKTKLGCS